ncbi:MAG: sulfotransferase [Bacteroidota bacterium]
MAEQKTAVKRPFSHPLYGSSFSNLRKLLKQNRPVDSKYWLQLATAYGSSIFRAPASAIERMVASRKINKIKDMKPPIFIVGHWRSGTTHICNVLSKASQFGFVSPIATGIPWDILLIGKTFRPMLEKSLPTDRLIDRVKVSPDAPQEDEFGIANMFHVSFLHGLYFPQNFHENFTKGIFLESCSEEEIAQWKRTFKYYLQKVYLDQQEKQLLIRNPAYTTRIKEIKAIFPGAKFIHIYRNPYVLFHSMSNYFRKLFPALAFQDYSHIDTDKFILENYTKMMNKIIEDAKDMQEDEFIEVKYEDLEQQPFQQLEKVYNQLKLKDYDVDLPRFQTYLESISGYKKNAYQQPPEVISMINENWGSFISHWGYERKS